MDCGLRNTDCGLGIKHGLGIGVMNGPSKSLTVVKFYLCSICSQNLNECSLARAPQIFALLASSQSNFFISARARKKIAVLGMLANARKDHSSPLGIKMRTAD